MTNGDAAGIPPPPLQPPAKGNPLKWLLIGCGCMLFLGIATVAGCGALAWFAVQKVTTELGAQAEAYLRGRPEIIQELGTLTRVEQQPLGFSIKTSSAGGRASLVFMIAGDRGSGGATVWLRQTNGRWEAVGCEVDTADRRKIKAGERVEMGD